MSTFIKLHTETGGRPMLVAVEHIQCVVEEKGKKPYFDSKGVWIIPPSKRTRVVMRDGEYGYCEERLEEVAKKIVSV